VPKYDQMKVFVIAALTADGFLARDVDDFSMDWTSPEDIKHFVKLTKEAGVMVLGSRTFATMLKAGRKLPGRKMVIYTSRPEAFPHDRADPTEFTTEPPADLVKRLGDEGFTSVAICGGQQINTLFMQAGVVTDLYLTIEPILLGTGLTLFGSTMDTKLNLVSCEKLNENCITLHYKVV
jgi:dihydrofolate reductase